MPGPRVAPESIRTARQLYRYLMRVCDELPEKAMQDHYKHHVRQGFHSHSEETDPERVQQIIEKAVEDAQWILNKGSEINSEATDRATLQKQNQ